LALAAWDCRFEDRARSRTLALQALELQPSTHERALALRAIGYTDFIESKFESALEALTQSLEIAKAEGDEALVRDCLSCIGGVYQRLGDATTAIEYTRQALQLNLSLNDETAIITSLNNFGILHREIGEDAEAVRLLEDSLERARERRDHSRTVNAIVNIGEVLPRLNRAEEAVWLLREGLQIAEANQLLTFEPILLANLADALTALNRLEEALDVYAQALEIVRDGGPPEGEIHCQLGMARINLHRAHPEASLEDAKFALSNAKKLGLYEHSSQAHRVLYEVHKALGDQVQALNHLEQHFELEKKRREEVAERRLRAVNAQFEVRRARAQAEIERLRNVELARALEQLEQLDHDKTELLRELRRKGRELEALAFKDSLTGLPNRRHLENVLHKEFLKANAAGMPLPVAIVDVDDFKRINDSFSHEVGDAVLVQIGQILTHGLRAFDLAARYGGEEFVLMLPRTQPGQALAICERLRLSVERFDWQSIHPELQVTISVGLSSDSALANPDRLLSVADAKLYEAKRAGKNRVHD
jgi:diguanylate cyclase (GGDEF)-like protein